MTWAFLRLRGVFLHTPQPLDRFPHLFLLAKRNTVMLTALPVPCAAPQSPRQQFCPPGRWLQLTSKCAAGQGVASCAALLSHGSLPSISLQLSSVVFAQPVYEGSALKIRKYSPRPGICHGEGLGSRTP